MDRIDTEQVTHRQEGHDITYVMRAGADDWFCNILRDRPHGNPAWYHLHRSRLTGGRMLRYADFGANIGTTSLLPARIGHRVLAIEAGPENVALLGLAIQRNHLQSRMTLGHWAAAAGRGIVTFHEASAWGSTVVSPTHAEEAQASQVPAATVADLLELHRMDNVDLIKLDIEGAELAALAGFERIAARNLAVELIFETNWETCQLHDHTPQDVWARLMALGFDLYLLEGRRLTHVTPSLPQPRFICDVLATRRQPAALERLGYQLTEMDMAPLPEALRETPLGDRDPQVVADFITAQLARLA